MTDALNEHWLDIAGTSGLYQVSDFGRVRRTTPLRFVKPSPDNKGGGYFRVNLSVGGKVTMRYVAHLVLETFTGPRHPGHEARHIDGNCRNNRSDNLAWGTKAENMQDAIGHGTFPLLERRPGAKLTSAQAVEIFTSSDTTAEIAAAYGLGKGVVRQIKLRETWASVTAGLPDAKWEHKPKHSARMFEIAADPSKTRMQARKETGLSLHQIKRIRKLARLKPTGLG